ncbi:hypothetical protein [Vibrio stylophorae]|nr:hypothetical protein [Vibrio stylophorae]
MKRIGVSCLVMFTSLWVAPSVSAASYGEQLGQCLSAQTTVQDKTLMAQWAFVLMGQHPALAGYSKATPSQLQRLNQQVVQLVMDLTVKRCSEQTMRAIQHEGRQGLEQGFQVMGSDALQTLGQAPAMQKQLAALQQQINVGQLMQQLLMQAR